MTRSRFTSLAILSLVAVAACSRSHDEATDSARTAADSTPPATAPSASAAVTPATSSASGVDAPIAVADIDAWQKGMQAELKAVQDAGTARQNAKSATDTLNALFAANETSTRAAGAKGAGMTEARYQYVATKLSSIVGNLSPIETSVKDMPPAVVQQMRQGHEQSAAQEMAGMAPDVQTALRTRAPDLRKQVLDLAGARLKAAGMTPQ